MIPKDTYSNLYLRIYQAEFEKVGRTARGSRPDCPRYLADRPPPLQGPSAWVVGTWGGTGCSGCNNGPSALGCRTVRAPRGPFAGESRTVRACRASGSQVAGCSGS
jgi:hypothetical protein